MEQAIFSPAGEAQSRSSRIVAKLSAISTLSKTGQALDIGCGNGSFLSAFSKEFAEWKLFGMEFDNKHSKSLAAINGFQELYTGEIAKIKEHFDFVSIIHTLEHIESPLSFLINARLLLKTGGYIFIQVPNYRENPFELMTYDHASHFDVATLSRLLSLAGLSLIQISTDWVSKEISVLASPYESVSMNAKTQGYGIKKGLEWMKTLLDKAKNIQANSKSFGIFGSSIAATWTSTNLPHLPDFFVDEDTVRIGKTHLGKKIIHPDSIPDGSDIFLALQPNVQHYILKRYALQDKFSLYDCL